MQVRTRNPSGCARQAEQRTAFDRRALLDPCRVEHGADLVLVAEPAGQTERFFQKASGLLIVTLTPGQVRQIGQCRGDPALVR